MKTERIRVDLDLTSKLVIDDLIERNYFKDAQSVLSAAIQALQLKLAEDTHSDAYYDDEHQKEMDRIQLALE